MGEGGGRWCYIRVVNILTIILMFTIERYILLNSDVDKHKLMQIR